MSFSAGTFSINSTGQPVVAGTTISASVFNALTADLATGLSTCMLKDGTQTATAGIGFFAGTVSLPGIYFGTDTATGLYRIGLNNTGYSINGTKLLDLSAALLAVTGAATVSTTLGVTGATTLTGGLVLPGTAANITLGSNYISNGGTDAGFSLDSSNNATFSASITSTGTITAIAAPSAVAFRVATSSSGDRIILGGLAAASGVFMSAVDNAETSFTPMSVAGSTVTLKYGASATAGVTLSSAGAVAFAGIGTTASAANAYLDSGASNNLLRSTSSLQYKTDVEPISTVYADKVLQLSPIWYRSLAFSDRKDWSWFGLGAEDVAKIEPRLVHWTYPIIGQEECENDAGKKYTKPIFGKELVPDGVQYERISVLLLDVVKRMEQRLVKLER